jgi:hypothetical protein
MNVLIQRGQRSTMAQTEGLMHKRGYAWSTAQTRRIGAEAIVLEAFVGKYRTGTPTATTREPLRVKACNHG